MKQKLLSILILIAFGITSAIAQTRTVTGKVTGSEDNLPIPGVSVKIKGSTVGTTTNVNGEYSILAENGAVLQFSSIGFGSKEVAVNGNSLNVGLSTDTKQLGEVVVTAFGIERKTKALGYSTATVSNSQLAQKSETDPLRALSGKVAGVNIIASNGIPGSSTNISIRGNNSFLGNNKPLMVVDGIPFDNQSNQTGASTLVNGNAVSNRAVDLDPNNIESMTILKGANAAALYGSRAANGAVIITTKTGKNGAGRKGFEVALTSSYAISKVSGLPDFQNRFGAGSELNYSNANGSYGPEFGAPSIYPQGNGVTNGTIPHWFAGNAVFPQFPAGTTTPYQAYADNVEKFFDTGGLFENSVQVNTGSDKGNITALLSKAKDKGIIPNSDFTRNSVNVGGSAKLANKLMVSGALSYVNSNQAGPMLGAQNGVGQAGAFARTLYLARNWPLYNFDIMPYQNPVTLGQVFPVTGVDNPYWSVENNTYKSNVDRIFGNVGFNYDVVKWLNLSYKIGINTYNDRRIRTLRKGSIGASGIGEVTTDEIYNEEIESTFLATVTHNILPDLQVRAIVGNNINQRQNERQSAVGSGMVVFNIDDLDNTNSVVANGGGFTKRRLIGAFADVQFDYKSYLFLNVTGRNDWSSTLPKANRSFFYPSVSSSFVFSELMNKNKQSVLSYGKVRANIAKVGNDASPYQLDPIYLVNGSYAIGTNAGSLALPFNNVAGGSVGNTLADPNLTPEFTTEYEFGTELRFLNDRIGVDFTYYNRKTTNQIASVTIPATSGFTSKVTNFGKMSNKGIEIGLDATPVKLKNGFSWNLYGVFSHNKNMVVSLTNGLNELSVVPGFGDPAVVLRPGQPYGIMTGNAVARDSDGNVLINRQTGLMIRKPNQIIGDPNPKFNTALTNTFKFKGLQLSAQVDYTHGGSLFSGTVAQYLGRGVTTDTEDRLTPKILSGYYGNTTTFEPLLDANGNKMPNQVQTTTTDFWFNGTSGMTGISELNVFDASVFRLREVALGYMLPKKWLGKTPIGSLSLTLTARNLFFYAPNFPKGTNFDPETSTYGAADARNVQGIEYTNAPNAKRYGLNLRATF